MNRLQLYFQKNKRTASLIPPCADEQTFYQTKSLLSSNDLTDDKRSEICKFFRDIEETIDSSISIEVNNIR